MPPAGIMPSGPHPQAQGQVPQSCMVHGQGKDEPAGGDANYQQQQAAQRITQQVPQGGVGVAGGQAPGTPLHEQLIAKLRSELDVVQGNMRVLAEMLAHLTSPEQTAANRQPEPADLELLQELYATCKAMQERVVELIGRLVDDEMTAELLRINDELNNLFLRYSRYTKNKIGGQAPTAASAILAQTIGHPPVGDAAPATSKRAEADSLIDLSDGLDPLASQIADIGKGNFHPVVQLSFRVAFQQIFIRKYQMVIFFFVYIH